MTTAVAANITNTSRYCLFVNNFCRRYRHRVLYVYIFYLISYEYYVRAVLLTFVCRLFGADEIVYLLFRIRFLYLTLTRTTRH